MTGENATDKPEWPAAEGLPPSQEPLRIYAGAGLAAFPPSDGLDLYGLAEQILTAEQRLSMATGPVERLMLLATLAWYNRQRDTRLALSMAAEAMALLPEAAGSDERELRRLSARLLLTKAECKSLFAELDQAEALLAAAQAAFEQIGDAVGAGDAQMVAALLALDRGQNRRRIQAHLAAHTHYLRSGDVLRQQIAQAWMARDAVFVDAAEAARHWAPLLPNGPLLEHPALDAVTAYFHGGLAFTAGDFTRALRAYQRGCDQAVLAGQIRLAVLLASNVATAHANQADHIGEFLWRERAHNLARGTGWPAAVGLCLRGMGNTLRHLGQTDRARHLLLEALEWLRPFGRSRNHAIACNSLGELDLDVGDPAAALRWFQELAAIAEDLDQADILTDAEIGRARALAALDETAAALTALDHGARLARARGDRWREVAVLRARAELHRRHPDLPAPGVTGGLPAPVHYLTEAVELGQTIQGYRVPAPLLVELAAACEAAGDLAAALRWERQARIAGTIPPGTEMGDRLLAMQAGFETERLRTEGDYHRRLAQAETARAAALQQGMQTLEQLGRIGQQITANLDADTVFQALYRHATGLMAAEFFAIYLVTPERDALELRFGREDGAPLPPARRRLLSDPVSLVARCAREGQELLVLRGAHEQDSPSHIPGTRFARTLLLAPLRVAGQVLGVMSVQSVKENAYGEREKLIFRTLCAYGAIALANAAAYARMDGTLNQLRSTQRRLVQQEKHASLGQLVAGVAHEINTPLGVSITMATHLVSERAEIARDFQTSRLTKAAMAQFLERLEEGLRLLTGNLERAAELVRSFKQVSADRSSEAVRTIDLTAYIGDVVKSLEPMLRDPAVTIDVAGPASLLFRTLPGPLAQALSNLVQNAVVHAFTGIESPRITIEIQQEGEDGVVISVADNGTGMAATVRQKAFDPFFTTRRDSGGTGLGLHIVHNLVTGALGGDIALESAPGSGTRFTLRLPEIPPGEADSGV